MASKQAKGVTQAEILDVGLELFLEKGAGVTMQQVATAADVSRQMVYNYFKSRGGLLMALTRRLDEQSGIEMRLKKAAMLESKEDRIKAFVDIWIRYVHEISDLANELIRLQKVDEAARSAYADRLSSAQQWFTELVDSLNEGSSNARPVEETAQLMFAILSPQIYEVLSVEMKWSRKKVIDRISELLLQSLLN